MSLKLFFHSVFYFSLPFRCFYSSLLFSIWASWFCGMMFFHSVWNVWNVSAIMSSNTFFFPAIPHSSFQDFSCTYAGMCNIALQVPKALFIFCHLFFSSLWFTLDCSIVLPSSLLISFSVVSNLPLNLFSKILFLILCFSILEFPFDLFN